MVYRHIPSHFEHCFLLNFIRSCNCFKSYGAGTHRQTDKQMDGEVSLAFLFMECRREVSYVRARDFGKQIQIRCSELSSGLYCRVK
jgi:hypothetical protein